ncbi:MAG: hypothetical protein ACOCUV_00365 [bacterium]
MKGVLVIGGHVQGLGIIRTFGKNGIPCYLLDSNTINIAKHSKYCTKFIKYDLNEDFTKFIIELKETYDLKNWLIVPTDDYYVKLLSQNKDLLESHYKLSVDNWETIEKCYNKKITYKIIQEINIDMPKTYFPNNIEDLKQLKLDYPCIIKPAIMHNLYDKTRKKVFVCTGKDELYSNYKKILSYIPPEEVIIQEIIPGDSDNQYSACFFYNKTQPLVSLVARRKRQYPIDFGSCTTFAETITDRSLLSKADSILKEINYWGLCEVEFKRDENDGKYKFLEINPRTWKWHYISNKSDSPFLMSMYNMIYFDQEVIKNEWEEASWKDLITDTAVSMKIILKGKSLKSNNKNKQYAVFDMDDLKPFFYELVYTPYLFMTR